MSLILKSCNLQLKLFLVGSYHITNQFPFSCSKTSRSCKVPFKAPEIDEEDKPEAIVSVAAAKETSVDAAVAAL